jgi:HAD superfamily phosphatase (TIGR01668 family)
MFRKFYPDHEFERAADVAPAFLREIGVRGVILDIDNTIVMDRSEGPEKEIAGWLAELSEAGIRAFILSNGSRRRVERLCGILGIGGLHKAGKPSQRGFRYAMREMGLEDPADVAVIGDQLFTDIIGAKRAGMAAVLVHPLSAEENAFVRLKRIFEKPILKRYHGNIKKAGS